MNQSFDTELQVVLRALGEVVLPALAGAEKHVVEQLHLSMAALDFMRERLPIAGQFYRAELRDHANLAAAAAGLLAPHDPAEAETLRALADLVGATRGLRAAVAAAVERSAGKPYEAALDALVIAAATPLHLRTRAMYVPFGFEQQPDRLPPLFAAGSAT